MRNQIGSSLFPGRKGVLFIMILLAAISGHGQQPSENSLFAIYKDAIELVDKEKYCAAQTKLEDYIQLSASSYDPSHRNDLRAEAQFYHAFAAFNLLHSDAQSLFERFISEHPTHSKVDESRFYIGKLNFMRRDYEQVLPYLKEIDHGNLEREDVVQSRFMQGYCYYEKGKNREAMNMFRQIQTDRSSYGQQASYYYAMMSYDNGDYNEAYKALTQIAPDNEFAKGLEVYKASCLLKLKRYGELDSLGETLINDADRYRSSGQIWFILGNASFERGNYTKAIESFEKFEATRGGVLNRPGQYRMGYSFYQAKDFAQARQRFERCLTPDDEIAQNAYYYLGNCFIKFEKYENARTAYLKAADMNFNQKIREEALFMSSKVSFQTRYYEEALISLQKFLKDYPGSDHREEGTSLIGEILVYTSNFKDAIDYLEDGDRLKTQRAKAAYQRACFSYGVQLFEQEMYEGSSNYFRKALNQNQNQETTMNAYFWNAEAQYRIGNYIAAISSYNTFIRQPYAAKQENYALAYYGIAWSHLRQKEYDAAGINFEKYIGLADRENDSELYVDALLRAGDCEFALRNYAGALRYYKQVRGFNAMHVDYALYQIGLLYFRKSDYQRSAETHVQLAANHRKSEYRDDALISASETYLTWLNDPQNCAKYCRILIRDHKDSPYIPSALSRLAISEERNGNKEIAVKYYKQVVYDYCNSTSNVTVALSGLSNLLSSSEYDQVEAQYREKCPKSEGGGHDEMEDLTIEVADMRFFEDNFSSAKDKYSNYISDYPGGQYDYHAHYFRGECYKALRDFDRALDDYQHVYSSAVVNEYTIKALKAAADLLYEEGNFLAAMELYTAMEERSDKLADRLGAQFGEAKTHLANEDYLAAKTKLLAIYSDPNTTDYSRTKARVQISACEYFLGNTEDAFRMFSEIEKDNENVFGAESQYYLVRILYDRGEYEQSKIAAFYLKDKYTSYNYWKARAYLILAEDYIALGDTFQATKGTLESLANQDAFKDVKKQAKKRLEELEIARNQGSREIPSNDLDSLIKNEEVDK